MKYDGLGLQIWFNLAGNGGCRGLTVSSEDLEQNHLFFPQLGSPVFSQVMSVGYLYAGLELSPASPRLTLPPIVIR
jgi:hypothetical protein